MVFSVLKIAILDKIYNQSENTIKLSSTTNFFSYLRNTTTDMDNKKLRPNSNEEEDGLVRRKRIKIQSDSVQQEDIHIELVQCLAARVRHLESNRLSSIRTHEKLKDRLNWTIVTSQREIVASRQKYNTVQTHCALAQQQVADLKKAMIAMKKNEESLQRQLLSYMKTNTMLNMKLKRSLPQSFRTLDECDSRVTKIMDTLTKLPNCVVAKIPISKTLDLDTIDAHALETRKWPPLSNVDPMTEIANLCDTKISGHPLRSPDRRFTFLRIKEILCTKIEGTKMLNIARRFEALLYHLHSASKRKYHQVSGLEDRLLHIAKQLFFISGK